MTRTRTGDLTPASSSAFAAEFDEFFRAHHRDLGRVAYALTGSAAEADDVLGEAMAVAWEYWERVRTADRPNRYVRRIVVNLAANRVDQLVRQRRLNALTTPLIATVQREGDVESVVDLRAAILTLPPGRRACVVLRHVLDLSEIEAAQTLGLSVGTVKSQTSKGLAQLRSSLGGSPAA